MKNVVYTVNVIVSRQDGERVTDVYVDGPEAQSRMDEYLATAPAVLRQAAKDLESVRRGRREAGLLT